MSVHIRIASAAINRIRPRIMESSLGCHLRKKTRGQAIVFVGLMMMTLISFGALVVEGGILWYNQRLMQNAVDAAALAGAQNLPQSSGDWDVNDSGARYVAHHYAVGLNGVDGMDVDYSPQGQDGSQACDPQSDVDILVCQKYGVPRNAIQVTAHKTYYPVFGLDWAPVKLKTQATAVVGSAHSACIGPLFQTKQLLIDGGAMDADGNILFNKPTIMKTEASAVDGTGGNRLLLNLGPGITTRDGLADTNRCSGPNPPEVTGSVTSDTDPGNKVGQVSQGMALRQSAWLGQANCTSPVATDYLRSDGNLWKYPLGTPNNVQLTPQTCFRMIVIPILPEVPNGAKTEPILGFALFYISNWCANNSDPPLKTVNGDKQCQAPAGTTLQPLHDKEIWGYYVAAIAGGGEDFALYDGFGTKIVALVE